MDQFLRYVLNEPFIQILGVALVVYFLGTLVARGDETMIRYQQRAWYAALVLFGGYAFWRFPTRDGQRIIAIILRTLMVAGIAAGAAGILGPLLQLFRALLDRIAAHRRARQNQREWQQRSALEAVERERERRRDQELAVRQQQEARALALQQDAQQSLAFKEAERRLRAQARCELFFSLHKNELAPRFTKRDLEEFIQKYMADTQSAETVERYAAELKQTMEQHLALSGAAKQPASIERLARWYAVEKTRISGLDVAEELKETHLLQLDMRYAELSQEILESIAP